MRVLVAGAGLAAAVLLLIARSRSVRGRPHVPKATPAMHAAARRDATEAFQDVVHAPPTANELRFLLAVALHETTFGAGWSGTGVGSFNMGALQAGAGWTGSTFVHTDTHPTATGGATSYQTQFKAYASALEGWEDLVRELYLRRTTVREAARRGSVLDVAQAMRSTSYYEGKGATQAERVRGYAQALADMLWEIDRQVPS